MSVSRENYLKTIYHLQQQQPESFVKTQAISDRLQVSAASVSEMVKRLSEKGFISYSKYKGVKLTKQGFSCGQNMVRRHRIVELFLHQVLDIPWHAVHEEAEHLEHAVSDTLINRMDTYLKCPKFDPHGAPIPSAEGKLPIIDGACLLSAAPVPSNCKIVRVSDVDYSFLNYLDSIGLVLNSTIKIVSQQHFDASLVITIKGKQHNISSFTAQHIWVVCRKTNSLEEKNSKRKGMKND